MLINVEKEKLVIDLYYNQGKNVRQIAQEVRMSFRNIGAVLKKKENQFRETSAPTRAKPRKSSGRMIGSFE